MRDLYPLIEACDMVVLTSPLYFWTITTRTKAFLERIYAMAKIDPNPPKGRYEKHPTKDCALLMTAADDNFWTFEHAVSYYRLNCVNYLGWNDKGILLSGGCGGSPNARVHKGYRTFEFSVRIWQQLIEKGVMMKKCKITVLKTLFMDDLVQEHACKGLPNVPSTMRTIFSMAAMQSRRVSVTSVEGYLSI